MHVESERVTIERAQDVWTLRFQPAELMMFARAETTEVIFDLLTEIESSRVKVLRADYASGCLSPEIVDRFWDEVRGAPLIPGGRHEPPLPAIVRHASNAISRLLKQLRRMTTLCVSSFQGEVDLDLFGVHLAGHYRVCSDDTVLVNRILDRDAGPGSAIYWLLARYLGAATANHLLMEGKSLTAQEALDLRLVNRVVAAADLEAEAAAITEQYAAKPAKALASLVRATSHLDADLATYLERVGPGFGV